MTRHFTKLRLAIAGNIVLAVLLAAAITHDRREGDGRHRIDFGDIKILGPARVAPGTYDALRERALTTATTTATPRARPKPRIAGRDVVTGKRVALTQFRGKPAFVSLWATWNVGSIDEASTLGRFARAHESDVAFLGIDSEDSRRAARRFAKRHRMGFPSIWDRNGIFAAAWSSVPVTLVFDRRHRLVEKIAGSASRAQLDAALRRVTNGHARGTVPRTRREQTCPRDCP